MADAALVKNIFGSDSESEDADARADADARDGARSTAPAPARGDALALELPSEPSTRATPADDATIAKLSNIFGARVKPFDAATHRDDDEATETYVDVDGVERVRALDANVVRWRRDATTGEAVSNARFVTWDDGTTHLVVGDEYLRADARAVADADSFLYARAPGMMAAQRRLTTKMTFKPATLESRTHRRLTAAIDKRHGSRATRTMAYVSRVDPEREKEALDAELARAAKERAALERKQAKMMREDRERAGTWSAAGRDRGYTESYYERRDDAGDAARMDADFLEAAGDDVGADADAATGATDADADADAVAAAPPRKKRAFVDDDDDA